MPTFSRFTDAIRHSKDWIPIALLAGGLVVFALGAKAGWCEPLLDSASFRQTQTAISTDYLVRDDFKLAYETPVLGAPWSLPFEFPVYQFLVAGLTRFTGLPLDQAGRTVSIAFALGALALLGVFAARLTGQKAAGLFAAALGCCVPAFLTYSRAFLIESTALCFSFGMQVAAQSFLLRPRGLALVALFATSLLAALTKATTYAVALAAMAPFIALSLPGFLSRIRAAERPRRLVFGSLAALALPFAAGLAWVRWTDAVKSRNDLAAFTTSTALHDWNYGTWAQRLDGKTWDRLLGLVDSALVGDRWLWLAIVAIACAAAWFFGPRDRRRALGLAALASFSAVAAGPLVFTNLYFVHDYYFYALSLYPPLLLGVAAGLVWSASKTWLRLFVGLALGVVATVGVRGYQRTYLPVQTHPDRSILELASKIDELVPRDSVLLIEGSEWDSTLPYYAHRRALTNREALDPREPRLRAALDRLDHPVGAIVALKWSRTDWNHLARQAIGVPLAFEQAYRSPLGDIYRVVPDAGDIALAWAWRQSGFDPLPRFACGPAIEISQLAGRPAMFAHAPSVILLPHRSDRRILTVGFGLREDAYSGQYKTDGVTFIVEFHPGLGGNNRLFQRRLDPAGVPGDRGLQRATVELPANVAGTISLRTETGPNESFDWSLWCDVREE